ncbi:MAG: serine hydrolase [Bacteroidia bacterium]
MKKLLLILLLLSSGLSAQNNFISDSLDKYINREMQKWQIPGLAIAIVKDGKVVACKGYGVKKTGKAEKVDENTLFQIASNSKAFTGTSLALLAYQKKLSLDDKVTKWLPYFKLYDSLATRDVTVRDLLCHRLGYMAFQSDFVNWNSSLTRKEIIVNMRNVKPVYPFRYKYGYCNAAFLTAGEIIPMACDTSWDDYVTAHFFKPLNMQRSSTRQKFILSDANAAFPHTLVDDKLVLISHANVDNLGPAGSINSSVKDMSNWLIMQLDSGRFEGKQIIPFEVIRETRSNQMAIARRYNPLFPSNHFNAYGLGWFLKDLYGKILVEHTGGANGFVTSVCLVPEEKLGVVVLTNTDMNEFFRALNEQIVDAYLNPNYRNLSAIYLADFKTQSAEQNAEIKSWREKAAAKPKSSLPLKNYTGRFNNVVYGDITITQEKEILKADLSHHPGTTAKLEPLGENKFLCTYSDVTLGVKEIFFTVENGTVKSITISVSDFVDYMPYEFGKKN